VGFAMNIGEHCISMRRGDAAKKQKKERMLQIIALLFSWDRQNSL
jgi:hypothetical protein